MDKGRWERHRNSRDFGRRKEAERFKRLKTKRQISDSRIKKKKKKRFRISKSKKQRFRISESKKQRFWISESKQNERFRISESRNPKVYHTSSLAKYKIQSPRMMREM